MKGFAGVTDNEWFVFLPSSQGLLMAILALNVEDFMSFFGFQSL